MQAMGLDARKLGLILGLGSTAVGLVGLIQKVMAGNAAARATLTRVYQQASPQEQQAIEQAPVLLRTNLLRFRHHTPANPLRERWGSEHRLKGIGGREIRDPDDAVQPGN